MILSQVLVQHGVLRSAEHDGNSAIETIIEALIKWIKNATTARHRHSPVVLLFRPNRCDTRHPSEVLSSVFTDFGY